VEKYLKKNRVNFIVKIHRREDMEKKKTTEKGVIVG